MDDREKLALKLEAIATALRESDYAGEFYLTAPLDLRAAALSLRALQEPTR